MKQQKKKGFFTLIYSFIPGAAEMHMGFMKKGISLMGLFFFSFIVMATLSLWDVFILMPILIWFYSFFHARNLVSCDDETFATLKDGFIWENFAMERNIQVSNPALRKWGAAILIICGAIMLWNNMEQIIYNIMPDRFWRYVGPIVSSVPQIVTALLIIVIGIILIKGKKEALDIDGESDEDSENA